MEPGRGTLCSGNARFPRVEGRSWTAERLSCGLLFSHKMLLFQELLRGSREKSKHHGVFRSEGPPGRCSDLTIAQTTRQVSGRGRWRAGKVRLGGVSLYLRQTDS